jgi:UDP-glucose 4-epimerase
MTRVLVTGATGFIGGFLCEHLTSAGYTVRGAVRVHCPLKDLMSEQSVIGNIGPHTDWDAALEGVDSIVHTAARAHVVRDSLANEHLYMETNAAGTRALATAAARRGIKRFIYLSSIKVNGDRTFGSPFRATDVPSPSDAYGVSKWHGESYLLRLARETPMEVVIVRPPVVYGPGVRANVLRLMQAINRGWPLPLGSVKNKRSLVSVWNLCDLLLHLLVISVDNVPIVLVSDGEDLSSAELVCKLALAMKRPSRLLPVPQTILRLAGYATGRSAEVDRLLDSLQVDVSETRSRLGWNPVLSVDEGLARTAFWYCHESNSRYE